MKTQAEALTAAAQQFRAYQALHEAKGTPEAAEKAEINQQMAEMCETVVRARPYQARVHAWMLACFGEAIAQDRVERGDRLLEEVFELLQTMDYDFGRIAAVRDYVAARPVGEAAQEVGGVAVCLFALCNAIGVDLGATAEIELERILQPETMAKIRAKQSAKPKMSPLPQ